MMKASPPTDTTMFFDRFFENPGPIRKMLWSELNSTPGRMSSGVEFNSDHSIFLIGPGFSKNLSKNIVVSVGGDAFIIDFTGGRMAGAAEETSSPPAPQC